MKEKALIMLRVMMNRYHRGSTEPLLRSLPEEERRKILEQEIQTDDVAAALEKPDKVLNNIHYSWMIAPLQNMPPFLQSYFIAALPKTHQSGLQKIFNQKKEVSISLPIQAYLLSMLCKQMGIQEITPIPYLPTTPLLKLASLDKNRLIRLIDLLGIYDLANEVRQIINKEHLKFLYLCLSKLRQKYLRTVMYLQDKFIQEKLGVEQFSGNKQTLERVLHKRGLIRLAKALSGSDSDLLWHIEHVLDVGRSEILKKHWLESELPVITQGLVHQTLHALNFLEKEGKDIE